MLGVPLLGFITSAKWLQDTRRLCKCKSHVSHSRTPLVDAPPPLADEIASASKDHVQSREASALRFRRGVGKGVRLPLFIFCIFSCLCNEAFSLGSAREARISGVSFEEDLPLRYLDRSKIIPNIRLG